MLDESFFFQFGVSCSVAQTCNFKYIFISLKSIEIRYTGKKWEFYRIFEKLNIIMHAHPSLNLTLYHTISSHTLLKFNNIQYYRYHM